MRHFENVLCNKSDGKIRIFESFAAKNGKFISFGCLRALDANKVHRKGSSITDFAQSDYCYCVTKGDINLNNDLSDFIKGPKVVEFGKFLF